MFVFVVDDEKSFGTPNTSEKEQIWSVVVDDDGWEISVHDLVMIEFTSRVLDAVSSDTRIFGEGFNSNSFASSSWEKTDKSSK